MKGIVADLLLGFFSSDRDGETLYEASPSGLASSLGGFSSSWAMMTKVGNDGEGEALRSYFSEKGANVRIFSSTAYPTALMIEGEARVRYSALEDIREDEVISFIDAWSPDTLLISGVLLSFRPVSDAIVSAVRARRSIIRTIIADTTESSSILLLETLLSSIEALRDITGDIYIVGEALKVEGVRKMSVQKRDELLSSCPEEEGHEAVSDIAVQRL